MTTHAGRRKVGGVEVVGNPPLLELSFPWPVPALFPNAARKQHWHTLRETARTLRQVAFAETWNSKNGWTRGGGPWQLTLTFCPPDRRRRDLDGCLSAIKAAIDGMAEALNIDDADFWPITLDWGPVCKGGQVRVKVGE